MGSLISPGIYSSGPNDSLIKKDVYREDVLTHANTYQSTPPELGTATDYLKDINANPNDITGAIKDAIKANSQGLALDQSVLKKRLERALNIPGSISSVTNSQKNELIKGLEDALGVKGLKTVYGGVSTVIKEKDALTAGGAIDIVNKLAGTDSVFHLLDLDAEAAGLRYFCGLLTDWGIGDLVDTIISKVSDADQLNALLEEMTIRAAKNGDLVTTKTLAEKMGHQRAYQVKRDIIANLMSNYNRGENEKRAFDIVGNEFIAFYNWIDTNWDKDPYDATTVCLEFYIISSTDMRELLRYTDKHKYAAASGIVKTKTIDAMTKEAFPNLLVI